MNEKSHNRSALPASNVERALSDAPLEEKEGSGLDSRGGVKARIAVHSRRHRLCDADGISAKAAIDGLVHSGILKNDSPEFVENVSYSQEKTKGGEETVIVIEWL